MTKSVVLLFSLIFSVSAFAERDHELPLEQWSDDDSKVFAVLDEDLNNEDYKDYEEVVFDKQGRIIETTRETYRQNRYEAEREDDYSSYTPRRDSRYNTHRNRDSRRHHDSHRQHDSRRRQHRRRPPVVVVPPPIFVHPPLVSNICRSGPLGNGYYFCYFVDGLPRVVGSNCSCYLKNVYTGARIFFRGRVSTW